MTNRRLDRITGIIMTMLGALVVYGSWTMPRFEDRGASIFEAPGLTPAFLGIALALCGIILALRTNGPGAETAAFWDEIAGSPANRKRALTALVLTVVYGGFLFGSVPFVLATSLFVFAFIAVFELVLTDESVDIPTRSKARVLVTAAIIAVPFSVATKYVFQDVFLVQLP